VRPEVGKYGEKGGEGRGYPEFGIELDHLESLII
jgi:hypothetical protein